MFVLGVNDAGGDFDPFALVPCMEPLYEFMLDQFLIRELLRS